MLSDRSIAEDRLPAGSDDRRPRVLYLTHHLPYPPVSGGRLREYELLTRIGERADVHLIAATKTLDDDSRNSAALEEHLAELELFATDPVIASSAAPQVARHRSPQMTRRVAELLDGGDFDAVHLEGFYMVQHLALAGPRPKTILVEHNVEHDLWRQRAENAEDAEEAARMRARAAGTEAEELEAWRRADVLGAVTEQDRAAIAAQTGREVELIPNGADHLVPGRHPHREGDRPTMALVGNFAYEPNVDGARWFCSRILPIVLGEVPSARLRIIGASPPPEIEAIGSHPAVEVTGFVPDLGPEVHGADIVVCPLRVGGGIKVKVLEALARGKATVTTSIGVQGLGSAARSAMRVCDGTDDFAAATIALLRDPALCAELAQRALGFAATLPTWEEGADRLARIYLEAVRERVGTALAGADPPRRLGRGLRPLPPDRSVTGQDSGRVGGGQGI